VLYRLFFFHISSDKQPWCIAHSVCPEKDTKIRCSHWWKTKKCTRTLLSWAKPKNVQRWKEHHVQTSLISFNLFDRIGETTAIIVSEVCRNWRKEKIKAAYPFLKRLEKIKAAYPFLKRLNEYQGECESSEVGHFSVRKKRQIKNEAKCQWLFWKMMHDLWRTIKMFIFTAFCSVSK